MAPTRQQRISLPAAQPSRFALVPAQAGPLRSLAIVLVVVVLLLVGIGVAMVQSAGQVVAIANGANPWSGAIRQGGYALVGILCMVLLSQVSSRTMRRYAWWILGLGFLLQILVYTPLGYEAGGNRNWLQLGPLSAQPAEFMKFVLLIWVATVLTTKEPLLRHWQHVWIPVIPIVALSMFINVIGGDLGTLMILGALIFGCLIFAQVRARILAGIALLGVAGVAIMTLIKPNRVYRLTHFFEVDCLTDLEHAMDMCWQSLNGFWALSAGGIFGAGFGNSKAKWQWLPEAETDFIYAIIGEELGLIGTLGVLALYLVLAVVCIALINRFTSTFARILTGGAVVWISTQMIVNIAVVLGYAPVLGVPLPFVSAGGTSLISTLLCVGAVLACVREEAALVAFDEREDGEDSEVVALANDEGFPAARREAAFEDVVDPRHRK